MSEEKKDLTPSGDKPSEASTPSEGTDEKKSSSPSDASAGKEGANEELESLKTQYSESSKEAKRLKALTDDQIESLQEKEDYIESLEKALNEKDEEDEKSEEKKPEEKKPEEKKPEEKKPELPPHLTKEGQARVMKELLKQDKKETEEAGKHYDAALKEFPRLKNDTYAKLVSQKMKLDKVSVKDACKKVSEDLESLGGKGSDDEPFVEGGAGESTIQPQKTEEDDIKESLKRPTGSENLPGFN